MIKERLIQVIENKGIAKESFYKKIGMTSASFRGNAKKTPLNSNAIENILSEITDLNPEWLLTGKGEMLKKENPLTSDKKISFDFVREQLDKLLDGVVKLEWGEDPFIVKKKEDYSYNPGIPLIPVEAMAGFGTGSKQIMDYDTVKYNVPEFTELNAEFMIRVKGSSMYPKYSSGDILACKKITMSFFQWNKVYVLDTEQGALIKRIYPSEKEGYISCVSDNEKYQPFDLSIEEINAIAIVLGVIRLE